MKKIQNADLNTFEEVSKEYYRDKNNVFYYDNYDGDVKKVKGADAKTFEAIEGYALGRDKNAVYDRGKLIKGLDPVTFEDLNGDFYKDKNGVYYEGMLMKGIDSKSFEPFVNYTHVKDKNGIYSFYQKENEVVVEKVEISPEIDLKTLQPIENYSEYSKDKNNVYYHFKKIESADIKTFEPEGYSIGKDKMGVYYETRKVNGVDVNSFEVLKNDFFKDKNNVYYKNKKIEGADKNTFELTYDFGSVVNGYYSKDKNNVYYENKKLKGIDVKTFKKISRLVDNFLIEDKNGFYIVEKDGSIAPIDGKEVDIENLSQLAIKTNLYHDKDSMYFVKNHKLVKIKDAPKVDPYNLSTYNDKYINKYNVVYYLDTDEGAFRKLEKAESRQFSAYGDTEYAKGRKNVYFKGKILADADYESFGMKYNHEKDVYEIRDKNKVYETVKAD